MDTVDINHSNWDCTLEPSNHKRGFALRLGLRQIKGFSPDDADLIMKNKANGYKNIDDFTLRTALSPDALNRLADTDAFRSINLDRRQALWEVSRYHETGTLAEMTEGLPLFETSKASPLPDEPDVNLPEMKMGEHVLLDYATVRMSLKAHPMKLLRPVFYKRNYIQAKNLQTLAAGRNYNIAGIVLVRQRPGSASGIIFATLEDETGIANIVIWPKTFAKFRRIAMTSRLLGVYGRLEREQDVVHVIAHNLRDESKGLEMLHDVDDDRVGHGVLPKGRNFH